MVRLGYQGGSRSRPVRLFLACLVLPAAAVLIIDHPVITVAAFLLALAAGSAVIVRTILLHKPDRIFWAGCGLTLGLILGGAQTLVTMVVRERTHAALSLQMTGGARLVLDEDSVLTAGGVRRYTGSLVAVSDRNRDLTLSARGKVSVFAPGGERLFWGEIIDVRGRVRETDTPSGPAFLMNVRKEGVTSLGFSSPLLQARRAVVNAILAGISRLGRPAAALFEALLLGVKDDLNFDLRESFERTGSLHLLALSGLHVGVVGAVILLVLSPLRSRKLKIGLGALAVLGYLFLAGPSPSLVRAVLMLCLAGLGYLLDRETDVLQLLLVSAAVVIIFDPAGVRTLSFQLSYAALAGILTLGKRLNSALVPYLPRFIRSLLAATVSAQVFTAPLTLAAFGAVYPVGLIVSPLLIPLTTVFVWSGIGCLVINLVPFAPVAEVSRFIMNVQYRIIYALSDTGRLAPGITLEWRDWFWAPALALLACLALGIRVQRQDELRFAG